jgi:hypothetical protein
VGLAGPYVAGSLVFALGALVIGRHRMASAPVSETMVEPIR